MIDEFDVEFKCANCGGALVRVCPKCAGRGFIESVFVGSGAETRHVSLCPECKDVKKYSNYIQATHGRPLGNNVIPFKKNLLKQ